MRLVSFSVTNFRSITNAHKIPIGDSTVIIGRNNEGKSNILRALNIAMKALAAHAAEKPFSINHLKDSHQYLWQRDFPISLQNRTRGLDSIFRLEFSLTEKEVGEFRNTIGSNLNGNLPIEIKFRRAGAAIINVQKPGRGGKTLSQKSAKIAKYIAEHIQFVYIPAIRTEDEALEVVQEMLSSELAILESNTEYSDALKKIAELQQPVLDRVSKSIQISLKQFLPNIKAVSVKVPPSARRVALRNQCRIEVDDGSRTLLEYKGDGVKSLAALSLLKDRHRLVGASIVAIEEPESHLHPGAMHSLRDVIEAISNDNQVVVTTHCPLFVERNSISRNILISGNTAKPAPDISSIRKILGVRASDNLVNASHVLIVEGEDDVIALRALLPMISKIIDKAIKSHHLVIESIGGAGNLSYKLTTLANALCVTHVLLDNDEAGQKAYNKAKMDGLLKVADVTFVNCQGMPSSELEDTFEVNCYKNDILNEFGVSLDNKSFRSNAKWSDRMKNCFQLQGKQWDNGTEAQVKAAVANSIAKAHKIALNEHKKSSIEALAKALERKLDVAAISEI